MNIDQIKANIESGIAVANKGRKVRTISISDVHQALREAQNWNQYGFVCGGVVANAYKYAATTAAVYAIQIAPKVFALVIGSCDAKRSSSETTWATGAPARSLDTQRAAFGPRVPVANWQDYASRAIILTARQVKQLLPAAPKAADLDLQGLDDVRITTEISLAAGNCQSETRRVAELVNMPR